METERLQDHWQRTYQEKAEHEVSWSQSSPEPSLSLVVAAAPSPASRIIDVGGGASRLADHLLHRGYSRVAVLDISSAALETAQARLGERAKEIAWIVADITRWNSPGQYDVWHDRATFHFMVTPTDRAAYLATMRRALAPGGHAIIATFSPEGPAKCSGFPVQRYDSVDLSKILGSEFELVDVRHHLHCTPWGGKQSFQYCVFTHRSSAQ